jgi:Rrf2 family protein
MLSLSQTAGYAILALGCLHETSGRLAQSQELADCTGVPKPYLSKILNSLAQRGLIIAKRGYRGGFALARPAYTITVLDVVEAVEGKPWVPQCLLGLMPCTDTRSCPMHNFWVKQQNAIEKEMRHVTLADVADFERRAGKLLKGCSCTDCSSNPPVHEPDTDSNLLLGHPTGTESSVSRSKKRKAKP